MKGNLLRACALLCCLPLAAVGQIGGRIMFGGGIQFGGNNGAAKSEVFPESTFDVLEFVDGSVLHGQLSGMDTDHGLAWASPEAKNTIHFHPDHVNLIRFAHAQNIHVSPSCHLRFDNGDDLYGSISSLDNDHLGFKTWFGGDISIPRPAVRSITFLSSNYSVVYDGPYDAGGWTVLNVTPDSWTYHDSAFVGAGTGTLGRDFGLTNSVTVEFDLSWSGSFSLQVGIYCNPQEQMNVNSSSCAVDISPRQVALRQPQNMMGAFNLTGIPLALDATATRMHAAIQCDKRQGTVSVFVNNQLVKTWKDCDFSGGTGVCFMKNFGYYAMQNGLVNGGAVQLSRLRISQWQGRSEPESFSAPTNSAAIHFVNHDNAEGNIQSIHDGKIKLAIPGMDLEIPLSRVAEIDFAGTNATAEPGGPWVARAHFPGGGSLSFQLEKWGAGMLSGVSPIFGPLALQSAAVREIEFNLNRPKHDAASETVREFEELDE